MFKNLVSKKDKIKFIRGILQGIFLLFLLGILISVNINFKKYSPTDESLYHGHEDKGFIALSYFALDRLGDENMISMKRLEEHFEALKKRI